MQQRYTSRSKLLPVLQQNKRTRRSASKLTRPWRLALHADESPRARRIAAYTHSTRENKMSNVNGSKWIRPEKRLAIYLRDGFCCAYCNKDLHRESSFQITLDHLQPRSHGGNNEHTNLVTACRRCNSKRQDTDIFLFADGEALVRISTTVRRKLPMELAKSFVVGIEEAEERGL